MERRQSFMVFWKISFPLLPPPLGWRVFCFFSCINRIYWSLITACCMLYEIKLNLCCVVFLQVEKFSPIYNQLFRLFRFFTIHGPLSTPEVSHRPTFCACLCIEIVWESTHPHPQWWQLSRGVREKKKMRKFSDCPKARSINMIDCIAK